MKTKKLNSVDGAALGDGQPTDQEAIVEQLKTQMEALEADNFYYHSFNFFNEVMQWEEGQSLSEWAHDLLVKLVPFVKGAQAALYYADITQKQLIFAAGYAVGSWDNLERVIDFGQGLLGEAAKIKKTVILKNNSRNLHLHSPHAVQPETVLFLPLTYQTKTTGVLEIVFLQEPDSRSVDFLEKISENIAADLGALVKDDALKNTLEQLTTSQNRLQRIAELTREGIVILLGKRIIEANKAFYSMLGYAEEEVMHQKLNNFLEQTEKILELPDDSFFETEAIRADQSRLFVEVHTQEVIYEGNKHKVISMLDISQRKQTEMSLQRSEAKLEEAQEIVELSKIIEKKNEDITASITYAKRIQEAILPKPSRLSQHLGEHFVLYFPRDIVSGDFYWLQTYQDKIFLAVADCTGHGVPGGFMSMIGSSMLTNILLQKGITEPHLMLQELNKDVDYLLRQGETLSKDGMDIGIIAIDPKRKLLSFSGAHHPLIVIQNNELQRIKGSPGGIGVYHLPMDFQKIDIDIDQQTTIYLFSDGITDQFGGSEKRKFGIGRLKEMLLNIHQEPMAKQKNIMADFFNEWMATGDEKQTDDMLLMGIRLKY
ncbi:MAG TPA: hypothetical protein DCM08_04685 [Microscillaceae bacterium]|nr:hypothetical protein [Microscillaceae bacterium]